MEKVSKEAIEKAEITLGLRKATESTTAIAEVAKTEDLKKAEEAKNQLTKEYNETLQKAEELKAKIEGKELPKVELIKAEGVAFNNEVFEKSVAAQLNAIGILLQGKNEESEALKKAVDELSTKLEKAEEFNNVLGKKVGIMAKQPLDRKSVTTEAFIEKGGEAAKNKGEKTLSFSNKADKAVVADLLFEKATAVDGKVDKSFEKAVTYVELGMFPSKEDQLMVQRFLQKEHNIVLVK